MMVFKAPRFRLVLKLALLCIVAALLIEKLDWRTAISGLLHVSPTYMAAAVLMTLTCRWVMAIQLRAVMTAYGADYSSWMLFSITMRTQFYSLVMPGDMSGMGLKWYLVSKLGGLRAQTFVALLYLRLCALAVLMLAGLAGFSITHIGKNSALIVIATLVLILLFFLSIHCGWAVSLLQGMQKTSLFQRLPHWLSDRIRKIQMAFSAIRNMPAKVIAEIWIDQIIIKMTSAIACWLIGIGLGLNFGPVLYLWLHSVVELVEWIPISFSGLGTREISVVYLLGLYRTPAEIALAYSLGLFATRIIVSLSGGIFEWLAPGRNNGRSMKT